MSEKKGILRSIWTKLGFGHDARVNELKSLKSQSAPDEVLRWYGVSNLFTTAFLWRSDTTHLCARCREISRAVSAELIFRAHEGQVAAYSMSKNPIVPQVFDKHWISAATKDFRGGELYIGNDILLLYKTADVIDVILDVCEDLYLKKDPMVDEYLLAASGILARGEYARQALKGALCNNLGILTNHFGRARDYNIAATSCVPAAADSAVNSIINRAKLG